MVTSSAVASGWRIRLRVCARLVARVGIDAYVLVWCYAIAAGATGVLLIYSASDPDLSWLPVLLVGEGGTAHTVTAGAALIAVAMVAKDLAAIEAAAIGRVLASLSAGQMFLAIVILLVSDYTVRAPMIVWPMLLFGALFAYAGDPPQIPERSLYGSLLTLFGWSPTGLPPRRTHGGTGEMRMRSRGVVMHDVEGLRSAYERQIREAARQEERHRLARDLHDAVKQQIFVIQTAAATAQARFESDPGGSLRAVGDVRQAARAAMSELEAMLDSLQARPLELSGLVAALRDQCSALAFRTGAEVDVQIGSVPAPERVPPGMTQALLRIAQEALANVGRHARATRVDVTFGSTADAITLSIRDNGAGFSPDPARQGRFMGMANMAARASEFRGLLDVASEPQQGTTVTVTLPLAPGAARAGAHLRWAALWAGMLLVLGGMLTAASVRGEPLYAFHFVFAAFALVLLAGHLGAYRRLRTRREPA
jgi:signal transduction histidine kinase